MNRYVLGFCFNSELNRVVLIKKTKPDWQKGKINGVGGKFENSDVFYGNAMAREFKEETGADTNRLAWHEFGTMQGPDWYCVLFAMQAPEGLVVSTVTEEQVICEPVYAAAVDVDNLPNTGWLILMAQDFLEKPLHERFRTHIHY